MGGKVQVAHAVDASIMRAHNMCKLATRVISKDFHMNITLSVDEQVAQRAREAAQKMGKSLNQVVRDYLEQLAGGARREQLWAQFETRCLQSPAQLKGWRFNRDEANER